MICLSFFSSSTDCLKTSSLRYHFLHLAPVVQNMDSAVHWINLGNRLRRDLSRDVVRLLNNWGRMLTFLEKVIILIKGAMQFCNLESTNKIL